MPSWARIATRLRVPLSFLLGAAYLWLARPAWPWIVAGSVFILAGLGIRAAASGHIRKNAELATTGPYAYTRNPLYLGSILIALGFVLAARNIWIALAAILMFLIIYVPVIRAEESYLRSVFPGYDRYASQVPRFLPRFSPYRAGSTVAPPGVHSRDLYVRHREYNAAIGAAVMMGALIFKMLWVRH